MGNVSHNAIEARISALAAYSLEKVAGKSASGDSYIVDGRAVYYPASDYWRFIADDTMIGYGQRRLIEALDAAQLRNLIPETPKAPLRETPVVTGRDSQPVKNGSDPDKSTNLDSQPRQAESVTTGTDTRKLPGGWP
jgi:hypothetical protein